MTAEMRPLRPSIRPVEYRLFVRNKLSVIIRTYRYSTREKYSSKFKTRNVFTFLKQNGVITKLVKIHTGSKHIVRLVTQCTLQSLSCNGDTSTAKLKQLFGSVAPDTTLVPNSLMSYEFQII